MISQPSAPASPQLLEELFVFLDLEARCWRVITGKLEGEFDFDWMVTSVARQPNIGPSGASIPLISELPTRPAAAEEVAAIESMVGRHRPKFASCDPVAVVLGHFADGLFVHSERYPAATHSDGDAWWLKRGVIHRDGDLPALEKAEGHRFWFREGEMHRDGDQPAVITNTGTLKWFDHGKLSRATGPAIVTGAGRLDEDYDWWFQDQSYWDKVDVVLDPIRRGGLVLEFEAIDVEGTPSQTSPATPCRFQLRTLDDQVVWHGSLPCIGWLNWVVENRAAKFPELDAAMRARAMRGAMHSAAAGVEVVRRASENSRPRPII